MIILERPYVSKLLLNTISAMNISVLRNSFAEDLQSQGSLKLIDDFEAVEIERKQPYPLVYCNSENGINWIINNLSFCDLPKKIEIFKNKAKFRDQLKTMYPDFSYREISYNNLISTDVSSFNKPFIIKPTVGFFSMGVYKVNDNSEWSKTVDLIKAEMDRVKGIYPLSVMDSSKFIVEDVIDGDEFAVDLYFNNTGKPVILNIFKHPFSSAQDVSDRVYLTSSEIIGSHYQMFYNLLDEIGKSAGLKNFPMHIELRLNADNICVPIEANPMRFAGWCTTDIACHAYGINVYECFFRQQEPDWEAILRRNDGDVFGIVVADVPKNIDPSKIKSVDYDRFLSNFSNPIEIRKIDYKAYQIFSFLFIKMSKSDYEEEVARILNLDFGDYFVISN